MKFINIQDHDVNGFTGQLNNLLVKYENFEIHKITWHKDTNVYTAIVLVWELPTPASNKK